MISPGSGGLRAHDLGRRHVYSNVVFEGEPTDANSFSLLKISYFFQISSISPVVVHYEPFLIEATN